MAQLVSAVEAQESFFQRGLRFASGRQGQADLVNAHMWLNIAAARGDSAAVRLRAEIAGEMSSADIAVAQRAARDWLRTH